MRVLNDDIFTTYGTMKLNSMTNCLFRSIRHKVWVRFWSRERIQIRIQRWTSRTAFLVEVSVHKLKSSRTPSLSDFLPSFFLRTKCYSYIDSSFFVLFADFLLYWVLKPERSMLFFKIRQLKGLWKTWSKRLESFCQIDAEEFQLRPLSEG